MEPSKTLAFTGHRNQRLPQTPEGLELLTIALHAEIDNAIAEGYDTFLFGGCRGFDLFAAQRVLYRQKMLKPGDPPSLTLVAVLPFEGQADRWSERDRALYFDTLPQCDEVITLQPHYSEDCYQKRNCWLVDHSSQIVCYYDGGSGGTAKTVQYATQQGVPITNIF